MDVVTISVRGGVKLSRVLCYRVYILDVGVKVTLESGEGEFVTWQCWQNLHYLGITDSQ